MSVVNLISSDPEKRFAVHQRMAAAIVDVTKEKGGCLPQDLLERGFTKEETIEQWHMANAMAVIELKIMNSQAATGKKRA